MKTNKTKEEIVNNKEKLRSRIESKLTARGVVDPNEVSQEELYQAIVLVLKEIMLERREGFRRDSKKNGTKKICYMCMEFLVGRSLKNASHSLGLYEELVSIIQDLGYDFEEIYSIEADPGLGNGGLGRLAACFMDSLSSMNYLANGYSLLYENGLFKQKIIDGEQIELPDEWTKTGGFWLVPHPEESVLVRFGGKIEERWNGNNLDIYNYEYDEIKAVPYDFLIPSTNSSAVNKIRFWRAAETTHSNRGMMLHNGYQTNVRSHDNARIITKQLYPNDEHDEGKLLRLTQQYFLVSASLQSIIGDYFREKGSLSGFDENIAIHINDTHPALCIPELMRIFMDMYSYSWDSAWELTTKCVSYTNHTVLPEALEAWRVDLFSIKLPRIYMIIEEINKRFTTDLWRLYPGDWDRISRMSVIAYNQVRMANLSIIGSHSVNGVSKLHSEILKNKVFHDFYKLTPNKFKNVTNGITHRRWLCIANPGLCELLDGLIGTEYRTDARKLALLNDHISNESVLKDLMGIKQKNKESFARFVYEKTGEVINPSSIFDVQIKRMHEYKRQLLNALKIIAISNELHSNKDSKIPDMTFIFGCKAAPGYDMAKRLIKLIVCLAKELNSDPITRDRLKIIFMEDYNVSIAERLIPASDISEQISLAGKEASGTGCMKLMMNGALTLGTLDGANVEIVEAVGRKNAYIFGMNSNEVDELWRNGYNSRDFYHSSQVIKKAVDRLAEPIGGQDLSVIFDYLINDSGAIADPYMCLADFNSYYQTFKKAIDDYESKNDWAKKSLVNIANSGIFSSDNSIKRYAEEIWHAEPVYKMNEKLTNDQR